MYITCVYYMYILHMYITSVYYICILHVHSACIHYMCIHQPPEMTLKQHTRSRRVPYLVYMVPQKTKFAFKDFSSLVMGALLSRPHACHGSTAPTLGSLTCGASILCPVAHSAVMYGAVPPMLCLHCARPTRSVVV